jgi:uncharacterized membrane protein YedE/YeeE
MSFRGSLRQEYERFFMQEWSPYIGAVMMVVVATTLLASGAFWGVYGGLKNWGDWINTLVGLNGLLNIPDNLESPLSNRISIMDICLILGAFSAALFSRQFRINRPPKLELLTGAFGGTLMGIGATLSMGCTVGGFFTPLLFSSPAGWAMGLGLIAGALIGLKLVLWVMENISWGTTPPTAKPMPGLKNVAPWFGLVVLALTIWWTASWFMTEDRMLTTRAIYIPAGFAFGFILHRSRFCFSRVFREPFMSGEGEMAKAMMVAIALGTVVFSVFFQKELVDPYIAIPPSFWIGSFFGGLIFGTGMIFAGGCASGSLWRVGEGHIKLWITVLFFGWGGSVFSGLLKYTDLLTREDNIELMIEQTKVGSQAWLPQMLGGWGWAYLLTFVILAVWYLLVRYNETTEKFTVL